MVASLAAKKTPTVGNITSSSLNSTVATPIYSTTRSWNVELIDGFFAPSKAEIILKIPLSRTAHEDVLIWPFSQDDNYTC